MNQKTRAILKSVVIVVLLAIIGGLSIVLYRSITSPLEFDKIYSERQGEVVQRLKDIREAERAYKRNYGAYTGSFDTLINFLKKDTLVYEKAIGSLDDSLAVAQGRVRSEMVKIPIRDTVFSGRKVNFDDLRYVPYGHNNAQFELGARVVKTESEVVVPIFQAQTLYYTFLKDLDSDSEKQEIINKVRMAEKLNKYPGLRVGSLESPNNDAGNWEN